MHNMSGSTSQEKEVYLVFIILEIIVNLCSLIGNVLVIVLVYRRRRLHTPHNVLMVGFAVANMGMDNIGVPFRIYTYFSHEEFGFLTCRVILSTVAVFINISVLMLLSLGVDRFFCLRNSRWYYDNVTCKKTILGMIFLWLANATLVVVVASSAKEDHYKGVCDFAKVSFVKDRNMMMILVYFIPMAGVIGLSVATVMMAKLKLKLLRKFRIKEDEFEDDVDSLKTFLIILAVFIVCWTPLNIERLVVFHDKNYHIDKNLNRSFALLCITSSAITPVVFSMRNRKMRRRIENVKTNVKTVLVHNVKRFREISNPFSPGPVVSRSTSLADMTSMYMQTPANKHGTRAIVYNADVEYLELQSSSTGKNKRNTSTDSCLSSRESNGWFF